MAKRPSWQCPYCRHFATLSTDDVRVSEQYLFRDTDEGEVGFLAQCILCPNEDCKKLSFKVMLGSVKGTMSGMNWGKTIETWNLRPESAVKPQPEYIPAPLREDYREACLIRDKSPKASATLSRRCLQGMIRDFWGIKKARLVDEIDALQGKVEGEVWDAIDAVRRLGNIGAHMEKDINTIVEVDPEEARLLIELIEQLFQEWYVARYERQQRMAKVTAAAASKKPTK